MLEAMFRLGPLLTPCNDGHGNNSLRVSLIAKPRVSDTQTLSTNKHMDGHEWVHIMITEHMKWYGWVHTNNHYTHITETRFLEARHETQRWEIERHITRVKSYSVGCLSYSRVKNKNMHIFAFFVFDLFYVRQEKRQKILFSFWNSLILSNACVIIATRRVGYSITRRLIRFNNNIPWLARAI